MLLLLSSFLVVLLFCLFVCVRACVCVCVKIQRTHPYTPTIAETLINFQRQDKRHSVTPSAGTRNVHTSS